MPPKCNYDPHFAKGVAPAEIILAIMNAYGFVDDHQKARWDNMSLKEKIKFSEKMNAPKVGRPPKYPEVFLGPRRSLSDDRQRLADKVLEEGLIKINEPIPVGRPLNKYPGWTS